MDDDVLDTVAIITDNFWIVFVILLVGVGCLRWRRARILRRRRERDDMYAGIQLDGPLETEYVASVSGSVAVVNAPPPKTESNFSGKPHPILNALTASGALKKKDTTVEPAMNAVVNNAVTNNAPKYAAPPASEEIPTATPSVTAVVVESNADFIQHASTGDIYSPEPPVSIYTIPTEPIGSNIYGPPAEPTSFSSYSSPAPISGSIDQPSSSSIVQPVSSDSTVDSATILSAVVGQSVFSIKNLLGKCPDIGAVKDLLGRTPLMKAAAKGREDVVNMLLTDFSVDPNTVDNFGFTAIQHAVKGDKQDVIRILVEKGGDMNNTDSAGRTALHHTCISGKDNIANLLKELGADVNIKDSDGFSAGDLARRHGYGAYIDLP